MHSRPASPFPPKKSLATYWWQIFRLVKYLIGKHIDNPFVRELLVKPIISIQFWRATGYWPNLENPHTFGEKIQWLKLYERDPLMTYCADKYTVRNYVTQIIGKKYLVNLIGVYDHPDEIDFRKLPTSFVLKTNWGSGQNIICTNKQQLNKLSVTNQFNEWLKPYSNHFFHSFEWSYKNIIPKIICEKYIPPPKKMPYGYKFLCFHGKPIFVWVGRMVSGQRCANLYDFDLNLIELNSNVDREANLKYEVKKPLNWPEMISLAAKLAYPFRFVRVDFQYAAGRIYFGELTFYPDNGMTKFNSRATDNALGKLLKI